MSQARTHRVTAVRPADPTRHILALGVAIPVIYFGIQLAAAPFHPGYNFFSRDASSLGSNGSTAAWIFNLGVLTLGILKVTVAGAFLTALPRAGIDQRLTVLTALALASSGIGSLNAFLHPLPDPRHTEGLLSILGSASVLLPVVTPPSSGAWARGAMPW